LIGLPYDEANGILGLQLNSAFHIAGDFNLDGKLTNADVQAMLNAFQNIAAFKAAHNLSDADWLDLADVNRDGVVNAADLKYLMNLLTGNKLFLAGDVNLDGHVDAADILAMQQALANLPAYQTAKISPMLNSWPSVTSTTMAWSTPLICRHSWICSIAAAARLTPYRNRLRSCCWHWADSRWD